MQGIWNPWLSGFASFAWTCSPLSIFPPTVGCLCAGVVALWEKSVPFKGKIRGWLYVKESIEHVFNNKNKIPTEPKHEIQCLATEAEAHNRCSPMKSQRVEALAGRAWGAWGSFLGLRAAPHPAHLPALTFRVAGHLPEDGKHKKVPLFF